MLLLTEHLKAVGGPLFDQQYTRHFGSKHMLLTVCSMSSKSSAQLQCKLLSLGGRGACTPRDSLGGGGSIGRAIN